MTTTHDTPTAIIANATVWYRDDMGSDTTVRQEGVKVELYAGWARINTAPGSWVWVPREGVEQIHD
jgi:hypothetical protein